MDYIRQLRVAERRSWTQAGTGGSSRPGRRRASFELTGWEPQDSSGNLVVDPIVTFAATDSEKIVYVPVLDDHLDDGNKTVNLYLSKFHQLHGHQRRAGSPGKPDRGDTDYHRYRSPGAN